MRCRVKYRVSRIIIVILALCQGSAMADDNPPFELCVNHYDLSERFVGKLYKFVMEQAGIKDYRITYFSNSSQTRIMRIM